MLPGEKAEHARLAGFQEITWHEALVDVLQASGSKLSGLIF
jgi:hypothetical protein